MEEQKKESGPQAPEKIVFDINIVNKHIEDTSKIIAKLSIQLEQARGTLNYLRQIKATFVIPNLKQEK